MARSGCGCWPHRMPAQEVVRVNPLLLASNRNLLHTGLSKNKWIIIIHIHDVYTLRMYASHVCMHLSVHTWDHINRTDVLFWGYKINYLMESKDRVLGASGKTRMLLVPGSCPVRHLPFRPGALCPCFSTFFFLFFFLCGSAPSASLCTIASQLTDLSVFSFSNQKTLTPYFKAKFGVRECDWPSPRQVSSSSCQLLPDERRTIGLDLMTLRA